MRIWVGNRIMAQLLRPASLSVSEADDGKHPSIVVRGRANYSNIGRLIEVLERLAREPDQCVCIDLSGVESMDTAALEILASGASAFRAHRKRLRLVDASAPVRKLLDRLMLTDLFCTECECDAGTTPGACCIATREWNLDVFSLPCVMTSCREARKRVDQVAATVGFSGSARADVMLAVGEAAANAVKHGARQGAKSQFTVSCICTPEKLCVSVSDGGPGFDTDSLQDSPEPLVEQGRGLMCITAVMDDVSFHVESGTTVRMVKLSS